jgi:hypothetical protein
MVPVILASAVLLALMVMIAIEVLRLRATARRPKKVRLRQPRRQEVLEERIRNAFDGPREQFGDIFVNYMVWRRETETRLELFAGAPWLLLNEFTRALVVRHLWRALEALVQGSVVIVDTPSQQWSKTIDAAFDDRGVDPWRKRPPTFESGRL